MRVDPMVKVCRKNIASIMGMCLSAWLMRLVGCLLLLCTVSLPAQALVANTVVASTTLTKGVAVTPFSPVTASGGVTPYTYSLWNSGNTAPASLPAGLIFDSGTGEISGNPTVTQLATTYAVRVADNSSATASATFSLTVQDPYILITGSGSATRNIYAGSSAYWVVTVTSGVVNIGGASLNLTRGNNTTADITFTIRQGGSAGPVVRQKSIPYTQVNSGGFVPAVFQFDTPAELTIGSYFVSLTSDAINSNPTQYGLKGYDTTTISLNGVPAPNAGATSTTDSFYLALGKTAPTYSQVAGAFNYSLRIGNAGAVNVPSATSFTVWDQLPAGVKVSSVTAGNGVSSVACTNLNVLGAKLACSITLNSVIAGGTGASDSAAAAITLTAVAPSSITSLVNYAIVNPIGGATEPNSSPTGPIGASCVSANCASATTSFYVPLTTTQVIATKTLTQGAIYAAFTPVTASSGVTPYTFALRNQDNTADASLPAGMSFNTSTSEISGTPAASLATTTYTIRVTDPAGETSTQSFTLTVNPALTTNQAVSTKTLTISDSAGLPFTPVTASGGTPPLTYALRDSTNTANASLPAGLSFNSSSGEISGTPTQTLNSTIFTVQVTDAVGSVSSKTFTLSVIGPLETQQAVASTILVKDRSYTPFAPVTASGGTAPYAFAVSPTLPSGVTINSSTGVITGTPTVDSGQTTYTVTVTDSSGPIQTSQKTFSLQVISAATKVGFVTQPSNTTAGATIGPAIQVAIQDASGALVNETSTVTIAIGNNAGAGTLSGTTVVSAVGGIATFNNLSINKSGVGYTLTATSGGLTSATSAAFNVTAGTASQLAITTQPVGGPSGSLLTIQPVIEVRDSLGNVVTTDSTTQVQVRLASGTNGILGGTQLVTAVNGVITFSDLTLAGTVGTDYNLEFTSTGFDTLVSSNVTVTAGTASKLGDHDAAFSDGPERRGVWGSTGDPAQGHLGQRGESVGCRGDGSDRQWWRHAGRHADGDNECERSGELQWPEDHRHDGRPDPDVHGNGSDRGDFNYHCREPGHNHYKPH